jgi:hypothetical protein
MKMSNIQNQSKPDTRYALGNTLCDDIIMQDRCPRVYRMRVQRDQRESEFHHP